jgi:Holliday junction resolvase-like predicted endonuclease
MAANAITNKDGTRRYNLAETSSRKGDLAEYYAVTWLWDNDYEVFKNAGCSGPIDMIAVKEGKITLVDVKSRLSKPVRSQEQKDLGVVILLFNSKTRKLNWMRHKK